MAVLLGAAVMPIRVLVHPIDTVRHPHIPPGFRWAVHVGERWSDMETCLNAGWEPTVSAAAIAGEAAAVCAAKVALLHGTDVDARTVELEHDPVEQGNDRIVVLADGGDPAGGRG